VKKDAQAGKSDHGIPRPICDCMVMKLAKTPRHVPAAAKVMRSQKLSCASGQWYFRRRWTVTISVVGIVGAG